MAFLAILKTFGILITQEPHVECRVVNFNASESFSSNVEPSSNVNFPSEYISHGGASWVIQTGDDLPLGCVDIHSFTVCDNGLLVDSILSTANSVNVVLAFC